MEVIIDASEFNNLEEFHELIKEKLSFPDAYGDNLDDLWDCLVHHCKLPVTMYWTDFDTSKALLGDDADDLLELFKEADDELDDFHFEIQI
jgi:ribonuclease inhibitor